MTESTLQIIIAIAVPCVLCGIWMVRLEGRINTHQALHNRLVEDVQYIRDRIDRALNGRPGA